MATNTASSLTTHTGNGSTTAFAISFPFLADSEIDVTVAGVAKTITTHYTISGSTLTFTSGNTPANGAAIRFQRDTDISAKKVDFQDGSVLTEADLDANSDQVLFAQQEITDKLAGIDTNADVTNATTVAAAGAAMLNTTNSQTFLGDISITNGDISITNSDPKISLIDNNDNPNFSISNNNGTFLVFDETNTASSLQIQGSASGQSITLGGNTTVNGNISVTGTVDGVDIAARNTLFGGLTSSSGVLIDGVTATTQSSGDNSTKVATTAYVDSVTTTVNSTNVSNAGAAMLGETDIQTFAGDISINNANPTIYLNDSNNNPDYFLTANEGKFYIYEYGDPSTVRFQIDDQGNTTVNGNLSVTGTVDGTAFTGDISITDADPKISLIDNNNNPDYSISNNNGDFLIYDETNSITKFLINGTGTAFTGDISITNADPKISLIDNNNNPDFSISNSNGDFLIYDETNNATRFRINNLGVTNIGGSLQVSSTLTSMGNLSVGGDITLTGTVDGVDIAALNTTVAGITSVDATSVNNAGAVMNSDTSVAAMQFVVDEDNMSSNSATKVPTQQSVKAYVDANSGTTYTAGTGLSLSGTTFNVDQIALTTVQTAANESAQLALTTQEGDIVVRSDQNKSYVRNSGSAGTMADFTELLTPTDQVLSVNGNTGAITAAQIAAAVEAASNSNTFTDADHSKLNGIEASADVTDATNVASAGAVMDGDFTSNGFMKRTGAGSYTVDTNTYLTSIPSSYLQNLSEDSSPQLGGDLDMNSKFISSGVLGIKNTGSQSQLQLFCESNNAHYAAIQAPAHSVFSGNVVLTLPAAAGSQSLVGTTETQTLTNKTLTSAVLNTGVSGSAILDEDNMASNSSTQLATQQSIKAYVDSSVASAGGGDITGVTAGTGLSGGGNSGSVTLNIDSTVTTLTGSQTLTNKSLTSPVITGSLSGDAFLDEDNFSSDSATKVASQQSIKAYVGSYVTAAINNLPSFVTNFTNASNSTTVSTLAIKNYVDSNSGSGSGGVTVQEEGSSLSTSGSTLNFVGNLITASGSGTTKTITVAGDWAVSKATTNNNKATVAGYQAGNNLSEGSTSNVNHGEYVTLYGFRAGQSITSAHNVTAIGFCLQNVTTGTGNSGLGAYCLTSCTTGGYNTGIGAGALEQVTSSSNNVGVGHQAGAAVTTGSNNIFLGEGAGFTGTNNLTTGSNNILIGYDAVASSATVNNEVTIGNSSTSKFRVPGINVVLKDNGGTPTNGHVLTVDANGEAGFAAASGGGLSSDAQGNTVGGTDAGSSFSGTSAIRNTLIGYNAGKTITTGDNNTIFGYNVLGYNSTAVTGSGNIGLGYYVLGDVTSGFDNIALGKFTGSSLTEGYWNVAIGRSAFDNATTAVGNICVGYSAGNDITTGESNTFMGYEAGDNTTTGGYNVAIGYQARPASATTSNSVTLGSTNIGSLRCNVQTISSLSDRRDKTDINILDLGLDFIKSLNPVKFKWATRDGNGKDGSYEAGFIAQDFQQLQKENDADYLGLVMDENPDRLEASYGKLVPILVKAIQELTIEVEKLKLNG